MTIEIVTTALPTAVEAAVRGQQALLHVENLLFDAMIARGETKLSPVDLEAAVMMHTAVNQLRADAANELCPSDFSEGLALLKAEFAARGL